MRMKCYQSETLKGVTTDILYSIITDPSEIAANFTLEEQQMIDWGDRIPVIIMVEVSAPNVTPGSATSAPCLVDPLDIGPSVGSVIVDQRLYIEALNAFNFSKRMRA